MENTSKRLREIMSEKGLRQVDVIELCKPYCKKFNAKLQKNDLSQYINGKVIPSQYKLTILGLALGVNEAWLMGMDVEKYRKTSSVSTIEVTKDEEELMYKISTFNKEERKMVETIVDTIYKAKEKGICINELTEDTKNK